MNITVGKKALLITFLLMISLVHLFSQRVLAGRDRVVKVNKQIITLDELKKTHAEINKLMLLSQQRELSEKEVLKTMIDEALFRSEVKDSNMVLDESMYNTEVENLKNQYKYAMMQKDPDYVYTEEGFKKYIEAEGDMTYEDFKEKVKEKVMIQQFIYKRAQEKIQAIMTKQYTESELQAIYNQYINNFVMPESVEAKHIFLQTINMAGQPMSAEDKAIVKKRMEDILRRLKEGEDFDELCLLNSEHKESRDKDPRGYLGFIPIGGQEAEIIKEEFGVETFNALFSLKENSYSSALESKFGYHIFYVIKKHSARLLPFEEVREQIVQEIQRVDQQKTLAEEYQNILDDLHKKAEIVWYKEEYKLEG